MIDLTIDETQLARSIQRARERGIIIRSCCQCLIVTPADITPIHRKQPGKILLRRD